jgi:hypothetical protein
MTKWEIDRDESTHKQASEIDREADVAHAGGANIGAKHTPLTLTNAKGQWESEILTHEERQELSSDNVRTKEHQRDLNASLMRCLFD